MVIIIRLFAETINFFQDRNPIILLYKLKK